MTSIFRVLGGCLAAIVLAAGAAPALAQNTALDPSLYDPHTIIEEVRVGGSLSNLELLPGAPFLIPDVSSFGKARLDSVHLDVIFRQPDLPFWSWIGSPRIDIGGVINLQGFESFAHAGFKWRADLRDTPLFVEADLGLGVHNGYLDNAPAGYRNLGCRVLGHWGLGAGINLSDDVTLTVEWKHISSLHLCQPNNGVNNLGLVLGWKF